MRVGVQGELGAQFGAQPAQQRRVRARSQVDVLVRVESGGALGQRRGVVVQLDRLERVGCKQRPERGAWLVRVGVGVGGWGWG